jgi:hypothetical protein
VPVTSALRARTSARGQRRGQLRALLRAAEINSDRLSRLNIAVSACSSRVVVPAVGGSSPLAHPSCPCKLVFFFEPVERRGVNGGVNFVVVMALAGQAAKRRGTR